MSQATTGTVIDRRQRSMGDEIGQNVLSNRDAVSTTQIASTRAAEEVKAMMVIAKSMPRDEIAAITRIRNACKREGLAKAALYSYPKGGQNVTGPSIRLAEVMAQCWGNIDFGIIELEQRFGESTMMSYAWDLETNTRRQVQFTVKHVRTRNNRQTGGKDRIELDDPRDVYEMNANQGARRLRACILGVIPPDVRDAAIEEVEKTMQGNNQEPLEDRLCRMVQAFSDLQVTQDMIERRLGYPIKNATEKNLLDLRGVYTALKDGQYSREDYFDVTESTGGKQSAPSQSLAEQVRQNTQPKAPPATEQAEPQSQPAAETATASATSQPAETYESFYEWMEGAAQAANIPSAAFSEAIKNLSLNTKVKSNNQPGRHDRAGVIQAINEGRFDWEAASIKIKE